MNSCMIPFFPGSGGESMCCSTLQRVVASDILALHEGEGETMPAPPFTSSRWYAARWSLWRVRNLGLPRRGRKATTTKCHKINLGWQGQENRRRNGREEQRACLGGEDVGCDGWWVIRVSKIPGYPHSKPVSNTQAPRSWSDGA